MIPVELAEEFYEAYRAATGGKSVVTGADLPDWVEVGDAVQEAWRAVARLAENRMEEEFRSREALRS